MEVYLAAVISFHLKPRKRLWKADGVQSLIEIVVPKTIEERRTKEFGQDEAEKRLSYLASLVDSRGWAVRGIEVPQAENAMQDDMFFEAQQTEDVLDDASSLTHTFDNMIDKAEAKRRQDAINMMNRPVAVPTTPAVTTQVQVTQPVPAATPAQPTPELAAPVVFNPYPGSMRQTVVQPQAAQPALAPQQPVAAPITPRPAPATTTSNQPISAGIMNLANNSDLSIETLAHEAKRIRDKEGSSDGEVVISLR